MNYTVELFMAETGQKRGTIEEFRKVLRDVNILEQNESLNESHLDLFRKVQSYKNANGVTWSDAFEIVISDTLLFSKVKVDFDNNIILKDLLWRINEDLLKVTQPLLNLDRTSKEYHEEFHNILEVIIDNFTYQDAGTFKDSRGTDGNPITTFKCEDVNNEYFYYLIGKYSHVLKTEEIHVFYNDSKYFNVMKLKYITGGNSKEGIYSELFNACRNKVIK